MWLTEKVSLTRLAIGIDVHGEKCAAYALYAGQNEPSRKQQAFIEAFNQDFRRFPSDAGGMASLSKRLGRSNEVGILIENSTKSHDVYWMLTSLGYEVVVAHATDLYLITKSVSKNDDKDAEKLAGYMRRRMNGEVEFSESFIPDKTWMRRRESCRILADGNDDLAAVKKQMRMHLMLNGQGTRRSYSNIACAEALQELKGMGDTNLAILAVKAEKIKEFCLFIEKTIRLEFMECRMFDIIYSIPGFGVYSAAYLASMIVDIGRFDSGRKLASSIGIRPKQHDSADKGPNCGITRRGDPLTRKLVYQATFVHVNNCPDSFVTKKFERLKGKGKAQKEALVAASNSMMVMIYSMIKNDREFIADPEVLAKCRAQSKELCSE